MPKTRPRNQLLRLPIVGTGLRIISNVLHGPQYRDYTMHLLESLSIKTAKNEASLTLVHEKLEPTYSELKDLNSRVQALVKTQDTLQKQFMLLEKNISTDSSKGTIATDKGDANLFADDHLQDVFYTDFEDRFRGSEETIQDRLKEHLAEFSKASINFKKYPVLDIGSGRGEFLQLLKKHNINAQGLDINIDMVERTKAKGLKAEQGDAMSYLQSAKLQSFGAITGFHIVEHIPFNVLLRIFKGAHQALIEDGFVLFETPNPENIIVGSCAFYMDPSHLHPIPPDLLAFALETCGFRNVVIRRLHPVAEYESGDLPQEVINRFYGPRDYAVIGYK